MKYHYYLVSVFKKDDSRAGYLVIANNPQQAKYEGMRKLNPSDEPWGYEAYWSIYRIGEVKC